MDLHGFAWICMDLLVCRCVSVCGSAWICARACVWICVRPTLAQQRFTSRRNLAPSWPRRRHRSLQRLRPHAARSLPRRRRWRRRRTRAPRPAAAGLRPCRGAGHRRTGPQPRPRAYTRVHGLAVVSTVFACRISCCLLRPPRRRRSLAAKICVDQRTRNCCSSGSCATCTRETHPRT